MATASSAQREPSMEEILASIRRIIEDSDTGRKQPDETAELRQDLEPMPAEKPAEIDAFRAELRADSEVRKPVTLAEVQAQLVQAPVAHAQASAKPVEEMRRPLTLAEAGEQTAMSHKADDAAKPFPSVDATVAGWRDDIAAAAGPAANTTSGGWEKTDAPLQPESEPEIDIIEDELRAELAQDALAEAMRPSAEDASSFRPAIVSEQTSRQVAAAFGELSEAFASRSKKTFDEMAEEMLRPMLRDWLDNNLPTLVERLVREEIERVARGA